MRGGHGAAFVWCFIPDVFLLWFQNGEVRGPRVRWEVLLDSERRGFGRCKRRPLVFVHSGFRDKDFPCGEATQGLNDGVKNILQVCCFRFAASKVLCLRIYVDN